jgi:hypothetical protein
MYPSFNFEQFSVLSNGVYLRIMLLSEQVRNIFLNNITRLVFVVETHNGRQAV